MTVTQKLDNLEVAVRKNTCKPEKDEVVLNIYPPLACSSKYENHTHMGIILYVGLARYGGLDAEDVCAKLCLEQDEWFFKFKDFKDRRKANTAEGRRFRCKIKLINNYLKLHYGYETI